MADDKFQDIIDKLSKGQQPKVEIPDANSPHEGLKALSEGFNHKDFSLDPGEGFTIEISSEENDQD